MICLACAPLLSCSSLEEIGEMPPPHWGPRTYQVDAVLETSGPAYFARMDSSGLLHYSPDLLPETDLPFHFYPDFFQRFPEILIRSPYPIRPNWFRIATPDCVDPGGTATGIEFTVTAAREKDYLLIARLDSTYWHCLKNTDQPIRFAFQILQDLPVEPTPFQLRGTYEGQSGLLHLKAQRDDSGVWHATHDYQPAPDDFSIRVSKHPQLGAGQSLVRFSSNVQLVPQSVWIGLAGKCLDQADWEVHRNRLKDQFLLDVVIPDCYLDCLQGVAGGFEFAVEFFQFTP